MRSEKHMRIVACAFLVFGFATLCLSSYFALLQWREMQQWAGFIGEAIHLMFFVGGVLWSIISLLYFRIAMVYFQTIAGKRPSPPRVALILMMVLGFPYATLLGAYALYARNQHMLNFADAEPEN